MNPSNDPSRAYSPPWPESEEETPATVVSGDRSLGASSVGRSASKTKGHGKGFGTIELLVLAEEWCGATEDSEKGTDQKYKDFWAKIAEQHDEHEEFAGLGREGGSLSRQ